MRFPEMQMILRKIRYKPGWTLVYDNMHDEMTVRLYWVFERLDAFTGAEDVGRSGSAIIEWSLETEESLVRRAFKLALDCEEHECREFFRYGNQHPFDPHKQLIRPEVIREAASV